MILELDARSGVVGVAAESTWAALEAWLDERGLTLGPLPGRIAEQAIAETFAQGADWRPSPLYGPLLESALAMVARLPSGQSTRSSVTPRRATGPDLARALVGTGARAGRLEQAHLRVWPKPQSRVTRSVMLAGWGAAGGLVHAALRAGVRPAWWRLVPARSKLRLDLAMVGGAGEVSRFDALCRPSTSKAAASLDAGFAAHQLPAHAHPLTPWAELGAAVKGHRRLELWDLRPEGALPWSAKASAAAEDEWDDLSQTFYAALEAQS